MSGHVAAQRERHFIRMNDINNSFLLTRSTLSQQGCIRCWWMMMDRPFSRVAPLLHGHCFSAFVCMCLSWERRSGLGSGQRVINSSGPRVPALDGDVSLMTRWIDGSLLPPLSHRLSRCQFFCYHLGLTLHLLVSPGRDVVYLFGLYLRRGFDLFCVLATKRQSTNTSSTDGGD